MSRVYPVLLLIFTLRIIGTRSSPSLCCSNLLFSFMECIEYVEDGTRIVWPLDDCCNGLSTILSQGISGLCEALNEVRQFGVTINMTKALMLPSACNLSAPVGEFCSGGSVTPATAPWLPPETPVTPEPALSPPEPVPSVPSSAKSPVSALLPGSPVQTPAWGLHISSACRLHSTSSMVFILVTAARAVIWIARF